nr:palmitoylputrescine synthase [uncultured bacterium]
MESLYNGDGFVIARATALEEIEESVTLFEAVSAEMGWSPGDRLRAYAANAEYLMALVGGALAGAVQIVLSNGHDPMPSDHVWPELAAGRRYDLAHASVMALAPRFRGAAGLFGPLGVEMWRLCRDAGKSEIWIECVPRNLAVYRRCGWPLEVAGELRTHFGEPCYLARMGVEAVAESLRARAGRCDGFARLVAQAYRDTGWRSMGLA